MNFPRRATASASSAIVVWSSSASNASRARVRAGWRASTMLLPTAQSAAWRCAVHGEQPGVLHRLVHLQQSHLLGRLGQERATARPELGLGEARAAQPGEQAPDHDRTRVGRVGEVFGAQGLVAADREGDQGVDGDDEAAAGRHCGPEVCKGGCTRVRTGPYPGGAAACGGITSHYAAAAAALSRSPPRPEAGGFRCLWPMRLAVWPTAGAQLLAGASCRLERHARGHRGPPTGVAKRGDEP